MILTREQINRYMRHIAIPEISGAGQKKLIESASHVFSENADMAAPLVYYLAACGIGQIFCSFKDNHAQQALFDNVKDLNPDVEIEPAISDLIDSQNAKAVRIVLGSPAFAREICGRLQNPASSEAFSPVIAAVTQHWCGGVQVFSSYNAFDNFLEMPDEGEMKSNMPDTTKAALLSAFVVSTIAVIEHVKYCLRLGKTLSRGLFFNLQDMVFHDRSLAEAFSGNPAVIEPSLDTERLSKSSVLIVGSGGLGSPAAYALAAAGIGTIGLVDYDGVELSNLNRQIMHTTSRIGMPKVESAAVFLKKINPGLNLKTYQTSFSRDNALELVKDYDIVIDGLDNLPTRYLLNDVCYFTGKPLVSAGVLGFTGLATTIIPGGGHCYRCVFPEERITGSVPSCSETGVLGPVPGLMGFIEAVEALKCLTGVGKLLKNRLLFFDALDTDFYTPDHMPDPSCTLCGTAPTITEVKDYKFVCESKKD